MEKSQNPYRGNFANILGTVTGALGFPGLGAAITGIGNQITAASAYDAERQLEQEDREYNSPSAQAARMRAAGINPDLQGVENFESDSSGATGGPGAVMQSPVDVDEGFVDKAFNRYAQLLALYSETSKSIDDEFLMNSPSVDSDDFDGYAEDFVNRFPKFSQGYVGKRIRNLVDSGRLNEYLASRDNKRMQTGIESAELEAMTSLAGELGAASASAALAQYQDTITKAAISEIERNIAQNNEVESRNRAVESGIDVGIAANTREAGRQSNDMTSYMNRLKKESNAKIQFYYDGIRKNVLQEMKFLQDKYDRTLSKNSPRARLLQLQITKKNTQLMQLEADCNAAIQRNSTAIDKSATKVLNAPSVEIPGLGVSVSD